MALLLNVNHLIKLMDKYDLSERELARRSELSSATISRILSGKRGAGSRTMAGIRKAFPDEPADKLFFLSAMLPNSSNIGQRKQKRE